MRVLLLLVACVWLSQAHFDPKKQPQDANSWQQVSVYKNDQGSFYCKAGMLDDAAPAWGQFQDTLETTGWGVLEVQSSPKFSESDQMFAAGMAEGCLTHHRVVEQYWNMMDVFYPNQTQPDQDILQFFEENELWMDQQISLFAETDPFWAQVGNILQQFNGLVNGTREASPVPLPRYVFSILNGVGDLIDLTNAINLTSSVAKKRIPSKDVLSWTPQQLADYVHKTGHCSGFIRAEGAYEDLFMAHSSWFSYSSMNRIYKHYNFPLDSLNAKKISFSSYPGFLESLDDFYLMDSELVMIQTTNNIFNMTLYDYVVPESLLAWFRVRVANGLAHDGQSWYENVKRYNSGTYNNQYMILDLSKFTPGWSLADDALWVIEQIPTLVMGADVTPILRTGYWPSYNVPFFETIYDMSGYPEVAEAYGTDYTYELAPRAKIFRRDNTNVTDMTSLAWMMRYNDYENDPYAGGDPWGAICSRGDLPPLPGVAGVPSPNGCYDSKITDFANAKKMKSWAINGPTNVQQPTFTWKGDWRGYLHLGEPQTFDFDWYEMQASWNQEE
eukprot:CAMPEP_0201515180 /NCGR_PEP_ID=MMETSP0161_2-20130828/6821_1 /ASSEMBLY_ACC=CAM_ASM_000251 /TAXON_ID=180227 /ORGANISM="Neoparamoeba aestuarina, Strain SoJaBio B1-5/56/2" /LENGTH=555 /DNA_ID=CAMNT_0047911941 /DNA_START=44 /DNA_END=1711 /DNA_ORIENTATION=+